MTDLDSYKLIKSREVGVVLEYNTTIKTFSTGLSKLRYNSYSNIKGISRNNKKDGSSTSEQLESYAKKRVYQRKQKIQDFAFNYSNWQFFITLTFDDDIVNSYSHELVVKYLSRWINNQKKQNPNMTYLIVPELHKSGRLHFHGLFANVPKWNLVPARNPYTNRLIYKNGSQIFNLTNYSLGFTTISKIKDINSVSFYISKYITKELLNIKNKKNIWHSRNLLLPEISYHLVNDIKSVSSYLEDKEVLYSNTSETDNSSSFFANYSTSDN